MVRRHDRLRLVDAARLNLTRRRVVFYDAIVGEWGRRD